MANNITVSEGSEVATLKASKFITTEGGKFVKSHTRLYMALILDVLHNHAGIKPKGYFEAIVSAVPELSHIERYCTVVAPAMGSAYLDDLTQFQATAKGTDDATAWFSNQAKLKGYSLSFDDTVRFFKGKWSVKAQKDSEAEAAKHIQQERVASAIQQTTAKQEAEDASNKRSKAQQSKLEELLSPEATEDPEAPKAPILTLHTEPGPVVGAEKPSYILCVTPTTDDVVITGLQDMPEDVIMLAIERMNAHLLQVLESRGLKAA